MSERETIHLNMFWGEGRHLPTDEYGQQFQVSGRADEDFRELARVAASEKFGGMRYVEFLDYRDPETEVLFTLPLYLGSTLGEVVEVFEEEATAVPATISAHEGGRGGDGGALDFVLDAVNTTVTVGGYVSLALGGWKLALRAHYREQRRLAKDWNDTGVISMPLRQAVLARPVWTRSGFDSTFRLSDSRAPELLRELGYQREERSFGELWTERVSD